MPNFCVTCNKQFEPLDEWCPWCLNELIDSDDATDRAMERIEE